MAQKRKKYYRKKPAVLKSKIGKYLIEGYHKKGDTKFHKGAPELKEVTGKLYEELKRRGLKSTKANVRALYSELYIKPVAEKNKEVRAKGKRASIPPKPVIPDTLTNILLDSRDKFYWEIEKALSAISELPQELDIEAPVIFGKGVVVKGGDYLDFKNYGQQWVNYIDKNIRPKLSPNEYGPMWLFLDYPERFYYNKDTKRWTIHLAAVDDNGEEIAYGLFDIKGKQQEGYKPEEEMLPPMAGVDKFKGGKEEPKAEGKETPETIKAKAEAEVLKKKGEAEAEAIKQKALLDRLIEEKKSLLEELKMWNELGEKEEYKQTLKRIKEVKAKIEKLNS